MNVQCIVQRGWVCVVGLFMISPAGADELFDNLAAMVETSRVQIAFRYRYEFVDQVGTDSHAHASTLRSRITWTSGDFRGITTGIEIDNVTALAANHYRTAGNGKLQFPIIADPTGTDVNQAYLRYQTAALTATAGRQRITHADHRLLGSVAFRQHEQTYDAFRFEYRPAAAVSLEYAYLWDVNRIFSTENAAAEPPVWSSDSHVLFGTYQPGKNQTVSAFGYFLDFDNAPAASTQTLGVSYTGKFEPVELRATLAFQSDHGDNPVSYDAVYYRVEANAAFSPASIGVGYEVLGSDRSTAAFQAPLATLHAFQGWADKFLATPPGGIRDLYAKLGAKFGKASVSGVFHDFTSDAGGLDYGSEFDLVFGYALTDKFSAEIKYATYSADDFATDTDKLWLTLNLRL